MKLVYLGRKDDQWIEEGVAQYVKRIKRYSTLEVVSVSLPKVGKNVSEAELQRGECAKLQSAINPEAYIILLDNRGKGVSSDGLAKLIARLQLASHKEVLFVIGGPYGFTDQFLKKAQALISLSEMTLPHQLARVVFVEQLYRAFTILRGESYHHS